ncbi:hypothetical protein [Microbacterium deminutum]|uniref:DUF3558 domain-containing protein n=1 Tax=Microbacterium deminutum TaxID=344164 RepID=A0ABP5BFM3_9MICO
MSHRGVRIAAAAASVAIALTALAACAPEPTATPSVTPSATTPSPTPIATRSPGATPAAHALLPTDCRAILTDRVLAELDGIPLNDPAVGPSGVQEDGSLVCIWADPAADTTKLMTTISVMSRGPALELLNGLDGEHKFTCYTPDGGTRCEATWKDKDYPVTDGRTVFWRDDILIDTRFSNLAPSGYTAAIIASVFG